MGPTKVVLEPTSIVARLTALIDAAYECGKVTPDIMMKVEERDELERLTVALAVAAATQEKYLCWINEVRGDKIEIVRKKIVC